MAIECSNVTMRFSHDASMLTVLDQVDVSFNSGEFACLVGPSGCGKSTLLNLVSGVLFPSAGEVIVNGSRVTKLRSDVGYMRQNPALFPWRTVFDNVGYGLEIAKVKRERIEERVMALLDQVGLASFRDHFPHQLSGGMKQRVSLARALAVDAPILLMDEPFAALDVQTRDFVEADLLKLQEESGATVLFVTHDLAEAVALGDRVLVMGFGTGKIVKDYAIQLPKPRNPMDVRFTDEFNSYYQAVWEDLRTEVMLSRSAREEFRDE